MRGYPIAFIVGGLLALIVGIFVFGIPCSLLAIHLGKAGISHGATTFGTVTSWIGGVDGAEPGVACHDIR